MRIKVQEHLSPSGRYRLIVETHEDADGRKTTKGIVYSAEQWVGEIIRDNSMFPFLFFQRKNGSEFLVSGKTVNSQCILNCETGHIYDNSDCPPKEPFYWYQMRQLDPQTVCVLGFIFGNTFVYRFFDFSNVHLGWPMMESVQAPPDVPLPPYPYVLADNDLKDEMNYPSPMIKYGVITFELKETRIQGLGELHYVKLKENEIPLQVKDYIDMNLIEYGRQLKNKDKFWSLETFKTKTFDMARMSFARVGNQMVMVEFWRSEKQKQIDDN